VGPVRQSVAVVTANVRSAYLKGRAAHISAPTTELNVAPGSIVVIRDEGGLVTSAEHAPSWSPRPRLRSIRASTRSRCRTRRQRRWSPTAPRDTAIPGSGWRRCCARRQSPTATRRRRVSTHMLADAWAHQQAAVTKALDPQHLRPRILIADAVGLGKTLEIGRSWPSWCDAAVVNASSSARQSTCWSVCSTSCGAASPCRSSGSTRLDGLRHRWINEIDPVDSDVHRRRPSRRAVGGRDVTLCASITFRPNGPGAAALNSISGGTGWRCRVQLSVRRSGVGFRPPGSRGVAQPSRSEMPGRGGSVVERAQALGASHRQRA
jgi:hypothetical protein